MEEIQKLNVTAIEPQFKHTTIYTHFEGLQPGEAFIIQNDHDPKPLYYALTHDYGQTFDWEYLAQGPDVWEVKISKRP